MVHEVIVLNVHIKPLNFTFMNRGLPHVVHTVILKPETICTIGSVH